MPQNPKTPSKTPAKESRNVKNIPKGTPYPKFSRKQELDNQKDNQNFDVFKFIIFTTLQ